MSEALGKTVKVGEMIPEAEYERLERLKKRRKHNENVKKRKARARELTRRREQELENEKIRNILNDPEVIGKAAKGAIKAQRKMAGLESEEN